MSWIFYNNWPYSESVFPTMQDHIDPVNNEYFAGLHQELINIEDTLGLSPEGESETVKDRLEAMTLQGFQYYETNYSYIVSDRNGINEKFDGLIDDTNTKFTGDPFGTQFYLPKDFGLPDSAPATINDFEGSLFWFQGLKFVDGSNTTAYLNFPTIHKLTGYNRRFRIYYIGKAEGDISPHWYIFKRSLNGNFLTGYTELVNDTTVLTIGSGESNKLKHKDFTILNADFSDNDIFTISCNREGGIPADTCEGDWIIIGILVSNEPA